MNFTRFPPSANLQAMATKIGLFKRLKRWLFGHRRANMAKIRFDKARAGR